MKKTSLVIVALLLVAIAILPVVGNKFMQSYVEKALGNIDAHGLKLLTLKTDESYLNTKKHFEFVVEDSSEFVEYINAHSHNQLPVQTQSDLDGTVIGLDVSYSNIPFAKSIDFALYPLKLSKVVSDELKTEDINFYEQFSKFLQNKGVLYYGEYNLINAKFKSYVKDIDEHYTLQNSSDVNITLKGTSFKGEGDILAPKKLTTRIQTMRFEAAQKVTRAKLLLKDFQTTNDFVSWNDYESSAAFEKMEFIITGTQDDVNISVDGLKTTSNAVTKHERVAMRSKTSLKSLVLASKQLNVEATNLNENVSVTDIALKPFESLSKRMMDASNTNMMLQQQAMQEDMLALLSEGLKIKIDELSLGNLTLNNTQKLGGLRVKVNLNVKRDADLQKKLKQSPLLLLTNMDMDSKIKLSEPLYNLLLQNSPMAQKITAYAKKEGDDVVFNITFHNAKLQVNGKTLQ